MSNETRTQQYDGLYPSQVQEAFAADAAQAAAAGWFPVAQQWVGTTLVVTYGQGPQSPPPSPAQPSPTIAPKGRKRSRPVLWISGAVILLLALAMTQAGHRATPTDSATPTPQVAAGAFDEASPTPASTRSVAPSPTLRATPVPTATAKAKPPTTPKPTTKPKPARTQRPAPTARVSGFGTRDEIVGFLEDLGFRGEMNDLNTGQKRWLGRDDSSDTAEVIGPANGVSSLSLMVPVSGDTASSAGTLMGFWLGVYAPGSSDFVSDSLSRLATGGSGGSKRFGDVKVGVDGILATDGMIVIVTLDHD